MSKEIVIYRPNVQRRPVIDGMLAYAPIWLSIVIVFVSYGVADATVNLATLSLMFFVLAFYFVPTIVACYRGHHNALAIGMLNLFLGWTFLGWLAALVWSCTASR